MFKILIARLFGLHTPEELQDAHKRRRSVVWLEGFDAGQAEARRVVEAPEPRVIHREEVSHRLSHHVYLALENLVGQTLVTQITTRDQIAHQLGVQHVLKTVREGFVA